VLFDLIPLLPSVLTFSSAFFWSCLLTGLVFFIIGSVKSHWSLHSWLYSGIETLMIGTVTASLAYCIGLLFHY
jgi:VIT1/CCC1 family predicted Fe2+/Mn2+ transporter